MVRSGAFFYLTVQPHGRGVIDGWKDIRAHRSASEADVTWVVKPCPSLADLAAIDLRRIADVLQVDHASLYMRDPHDPRRAAVVAEIGLPVGEALPEHRILLSRVLHTCCSAGLQGQAGTDEACTAALATPLVHGDEAVGAVLVVTRRANRRLGAIDSQVIQRATRTLVERFLAPGERRESGVASERFVRGAPARRW
jgi:hypothetical protein